MRAGPFTAYLNLRDPLKYLNYAIPDDAAEPTRDEIEALRRAFHAHDRLPRLEWLEEAAPRVAATLAAAGMGEELRTPLMACSPDQLVAAGADVPELTVAPVTEADLRESADLQRVAFGQPALAAVDEPPDPRAGGGGTVLARSRGEPVAAATWTPVVDGISEVAGVATADSWRGRGLAGVVTAAAARAAFAAGAAFCVLSPGHDAAQRVYARAGFARAATMLHWSDAPGAA